MDFREVRRRANLDEKMRLEAFQNYLNRGWASSMNEDFVRKQAELNKMASMRDAGSSQADQPRIQATRPMTSTEQIHELCAKISSNANGIYHLMRDIENRPIPRIKELAALLDEAYAFAVASSEYPSRKDVIDRLFKAMTLVKELPA